MSWLLSACTPTPPPASRGELAKVEADSIAYLVCEAAGIDSGSYSFGYVAAWSRGECSLVAVTPDRVIRTARAILTAAELDEATESDPDPLVAARRAHRSRSRP